MSEKLSPNELLSSVEFEAAKAQSGLAADETAIKLNEIFKSLRGRRLETLLLESRMKFHDTHEPGTEIEMSRGAKYRVQKNGSYKRIYE